MYKLLVSHNASVKSSSVVLHVCASLDNSVCGKKVEVHSNVCRNNVCSDNDVSERSDGAVCTKSAVDNSLSNKSICNDVFDKLSNSEMHVSVKNDSIHSLDISSKEQVSSENCGGNGNVITSTISASSLLWHQRMGHPSPQILKQVIHSELS